jgi:tetratricopeptide (TPR) repeat protein
VDGKDPQLEWAQLGLPYLLGQDLNQDNRLYGWMASINLYENFQEFGYGLTDKLPFSIKREMADDIYADEFVAGKLKITEDEHYQIDLEVYNTQSGELIFEESYSSKDPFDLIDIIASSYQDKQLDQDIAAAKSSYVDLPIKDLFTPDVKAYKAYHEGIMAADIVSDPEKAIQKFEEAIEIDPNFVEAHREKGLALNRLNQKEAAQEAFQTALDKMSGLSERQQFIVRLQYYVMNNELEKALSLLEMWRKLYPSNYMPYATMINIMRNRNDISGAIEVGQEALENGHSRKVLLTLASLSSSIGKFDQAKAYLQQFNESYPDKTKETLEFGEIYEDEGEFEKAKAHYETISLLKPNDKEVLRRLARTEMALGNMEEAESYYLNALKHTKTLRDSSWLLFDIAGFYYNLGHKEKMIQYLEQRWKTLGQKMTVYEMGQELCAYPFMRMYHDFGELDEFNKKRIQHFEENPDVTGFFTCSGDLNYYIIIEDAAQLKATSESCGKKITPLTGETMMIMVDAYTAEVEKNYPKAIELFHQYFNEIGEESDVAYQTLGNIYLKAQDYEKANQYLEKAVQKSPSDTYCLFLYINALKELGKTEEARNQLDKVLAIVENADPDFIWYQKLKALDEAWQ